MLPALLHGHFTREDGRLQALVVSTEEILDASFASNCAAQGFGVVVGDMDATTAKVVISVPLPRGTFASLVTLKGKLSALAQTSSAVAATRSDSCAPLAVVKIMLFVLIVAKRDRIVHWKHGAVLSGESPAEFPFAF